MRVKMLAVSLLAAAGLPLTGCAASATSPATSSGVHGVTSSAATQGAVRSAGSSAASAVAHTAPSEAARMICTDETRDNITTVLSVAPDPQPASTWRAPTYTCTYRLPTGPIVLSVHESADVPAAAAYTATVRSTMRGAKNLVGLTSTAFGTTDGVVVLRKDNDTLRVDTSGLQPQSGRLYARRAAFAYDIAALVLGCWTGG